jgi:hypothetical protein
MRRIPIGFLGIMLAMGGASWAPAARAHRISAQNGGVNCYGDIPCDATHVDGSFEVGVPGVNPNFYYVHSSTDSDTGHMSLASALTWVDGVRPSNAEYLTDAISEHVSLQRSSPAPVGVRITLVLSGGAHVEGPLSFLRLNGRIDFQDCSLFAERSFYATTVTDLEPVEGSCDGLTADLIGSALVITASFPGSLPTYPEIAAQIQADYAYDSIGSAIDFQWEGDLYVELTNATGIWDSPTFLTQAPEPEASALGAAAVLALALRAGAHPRIPRAQR